MRYPGRRTSWGAALAGLLLLMAPGAWATEEETEESYQAYGADQARKFVQQPERWITADHSVHEVLQQEFSRAPR